MKIDRRTSSPERKKRAREDLSTLLSSCADAAPPCATHCADAPGPRCSRHCADVPGKLSSDPEKHPLEPLIAPLVYEIQRLKAFEPCWSCEGHNGPDGALWKVPRVWFYCDSVHHLRALAGSIRQMELDRVLHATWQVVVVTLDRKDLEGCFSLEPVAADDATSLEQLQADSATIAARLKDMVVKVAGDLKRVIG